MMWQFIFCIKKYPFLHNFFLLYGKRFTKHKFGNQSNTLNFCTFSIPVLYILETHAVDNSVYNFRNLTLEIHRLCWMVLTFHPIDDLANYFLTLLVKVQATVQLYGSSGSFLECVKALEAHYDCNKLVYRHHTKRLFSL